MSYNKTQCLTGATPQSFATMEYSLRIYKNEYGVRHLNFIRKKFEVTGETEKTLEVVGKEQDLEMLMSAMFLTDEQFKAVFPDYQTEKECQEWIRKELADLEDTIARTLCRIIYDGDTNNPLFVKFRSFYLNELTTFGNKCLTIRYKRHE